MQPAADEGPLLPTSTVRTSCPVLHALARAGGAALASIDVTITTHYLHSDAACPRHIEACASESLPSCFFNRSGWLAVLPRIDEMCQHWASGLLYRIVHMCALRARALLDWPGAWRACGG